MKRWHVTYEVGFPDANGVATSWARVRVCVPADDADQAKEKYKEIVRQWQPPRVIGVFVKCVEVAHG